MKKQFDKGRRIFIRNSALLASLPVLNINSIFRKQQEEKFLPNSNSNEFPIVISTWKHGLAANEAAWEALSLGKNALDAVEAGVRISESDPTVTSVGYGGFPDAEGNVTLDACIMDWTGECGAVSYLQHIKNPVSVARKVMEETPHVMLSGEGALAFALQHGFKKEDLLTEKSRSAWEDWKKSKPEQPDDSNNHDTIGMIVIDGNGQIAGACTTSGLAWKIPGRVGDSPIIGAGMFVDGEAGGAAATGKGEAVIKIAGTHLIVELMRLGRHPQEACEEALSRIIQKQADHLSFQVGFIALNMNGETGASSLQKGFQYALQTETGNDLIDAPHIL